MALEVAGERRRDEWVVHSDSGSGVLGAGTVDLGKPLGGPL